MIGEHLIAENNIGGLDLQTRGVDFVVVAGAKVRLKDQTLSIDQGLQARAIGRIGIVDEDGMLSYRPGQRVAIAIQDRLRFAGTIDEVEISVPGRGPERHWLLTCVDLNQLADRFLVAEAFETAGQTTGDIVRALVDRFLKQEGVTTQGIQDGVEIGSARWQYVRLSSVFDELARETDYVWTISPERVMRFFPRSSFVAPWTLTEDSKAFIELVNLRSREGYRNRQYLVGANDTQSTPVREPFVGDGTRRTFTLARFVSHMVAIRVNGNEESFGVLNVDQGVSWYYRQGEKTITQDNSMEPLTTADTLDVEYQGLIPITTRKDLKLEQQEMAALEGGTGIYEEAEEDDRIDNLSLAETRLNAILDKYGKKMDRVRYSTDRHFLDAGMIQVIDLPTWGAVGEYLIENVSIRDIGGYNLRTNVDAISAGPVVSWHDFYRKLFTAGRTFEIRPDEIVRSLDVIGSQIILRDALRIEDGVRLGLATEDPYTFFTFGFAVLTTAPFPLAHPGTSIIGTPEYLDIEAPEEGDDHEMVQRRGSSRRSIAA